MSNYLLLRNNRESGPFSLESLVQMGLKPYDLIWVDGKSAAWRYPSEIPELKPYAPMPEEQPFDRFFKRPEPAAASSPEPPVERSAVPPQAPPVAEPAPSFSDYESCYIPQTAPQQPASARRSVFVTMPKGTPVAEPARQPAAVAAPSREVQPVQAPLPRIEEPAELETKYTQPLDDIKEMYVKTLQQRNQRAAKEHVLKTYGRKAAVVVGLLGAGLLLGFIVLKKPAGNTPEIVKQPTEMQQVLALNDNISEAEPQEKMPADAADQSLIQDLNTGNRSAAISRLEKPDPKIVYKDETTEPVVQNNETRVRNTPATPPKDVPVQQSPDYGYEPSAHNSVTGERAKATRDERNEENKVNRVKTESAAKQEVAPVASRVPEHLSGQLKVNSNDYKRVALGGIRDLRLTVTNESAAALAKVVVELQYLKPNEEPLKTEMVNFRGIGPNESSTIRMPDTNRGIRVKYKIVEVVE